MIADWQLVSELIDNHYFQLKSKLVSEFKELKTEDHVSLSQEEIRKLFDLKGQFIWNYLKEVDFKHPEIYEKDIYKNFENILYFADFAKSSSSNESLNFFKKMSLTTMRETQELLLNIPVRFFKKDFISNYRLCNMVSNICIANEISKYENDSFRKKWNALSDGFSSYIRFYDSFAHVITEAEKNKSIYRKGGFISLASSAQRFIDEKKLDVNKMFIGYKKLPVFDASFIMAKQLGCNVFDYSILNVTLKKLNHYKVARLIRDNKSISLVSENCILEYRPVVCGFDGLKKHASDKCLKCVDHADNLPELDNKPVFDNYVVLFPCFNFDFLQSETDFERKFERNKFRLMFENGKAIDTDDFDFEKQYFDQMIQHEDFQPIVLGERDQSTYFISYLK